MILGLGPVIRYELITTARRGRFYIARVGYGLVLLVMLANQFQSFSAIHPFGATPEQLQTFAEEAFVEFARAQGLALICLIPAVVAGVIADEHQRKTLHYLLASQLSSLEIVIGKLGARLVHVGTFVALGVPVVCLLALYGGLNPENVYYVYLGTLALVLFLSGVSILISIVARRPRDAILAAYTMLALWLIVPYWLAPIAGFMGGPLEWVGPVNRWVLLSNPLAIWGQATRQFYVMTSRGIRPIAFAGNFVSDFYWMISIQSILGLGFILLAVLALRPMRGSSWPGGQPSTGWYSRLVARLGTAGRLRATAAVTHNRLLATPRNLPPCSDNPMRWKEQHTSLGGGLSWLGSRPMVLFFGVLVGCFLIDAAYPIVLTALGSMRHRGSGADISAEVRGVTMVLTTLGMLAVSASAAVGLTSEREQDTWISLATTLLEPDEIIQAKQFGAVWSARRVAVAILIVWGTGLLLGAIHPLGVLACSLFIAAVAWLVAVIGVMTSAFAKNSTRSLVATFILFLIFTAASGWPQGVGALLFSYQDLAGTRSRPSVLPASIGQASTFALNLMPVLVAYIIVILVLSALSRRRLRLTWGR